MEGRAVPCTEGLRGMGVLGLQGREDACQYRAPQAWTHRPLCRMFQWNNEAYRPHPQGERPCLSES